MINSYPAIDVDLRQLFFLVKYTHRVVGMLTTTAWGSGSIPVSDEAFESNGPGFKS